MPKLLWIGYDYGLSSACLVTLEWGRPTVNLRQLQYFIEVSEVESVTKAAERLHVAQPALSRRNELPRL